MLFETIKLVIKRHGKILLLIQKTFALSVLVSLYSVKSSCYVQDTFYMHSDTLSSHNASKNEDHVNILYIFVL